MSKFEESRDGSWVRHKRLMYNDHMSTTSSDWEEKINLYFAAEMSVTFKIERANSRGRMEYDAI
jgi:hypothetical protein